MKPARIARDSLVAAGSPYRASAIGGNWVFFESLGLYAHVTTVSKQVGEAMSLYIAGISTFVDCRRTGIQLTCVGLGSDLKAAAQDAAAHWALGVLPVLAAWRHKEDDCMVTVETIELQTTDGKRVFDVLEGPVIGRGEVEGEANPPVSQSKYLDLMRWYLGRELVGEDTHWIECFAVRMANKTVDATCRVDNTDWEPGKTLLMEDAKTWPGMTPSRQSFRQFLLLHPQGFPQPEPKGPGFFQKLFA